MPDNNKNVPTGRKHSRMMPEQQWSLLWENQHQAKEQEKLNFTCKNVKKCKRESKQSPAEGTANGDTRTLMTWWHTSCQRNDRSAKSLVSDSTSPISEARNVCEAVKPKGPGYYAINGVLCALWHWSSAVMIDYNHRRSKSWQEITRAW